MAVNRWLSGQNFPVGEQELIQSLIDESIQMKGVDVRYLVRTMENRDFLFGESTLSSFKETFEIEMYLADIANFNGDGDMFAKFGLQMTDEATFEVSVKRFAEEAVIFELQRPREGDLILFPYGNALYEIKKVKNDENFNQIGKNYKYRLVCKLFDYSHEQFEDNTNEQKIVDHWVDGDAMSEALGLSKTNFADESELFDEVDETLISRQFSADDPFGEKNGN